MSNFLSKFRMLLIAGGAVLVFVIVLKGPIDNTFNNTPTLERTDTPAPAASSEVASANTIAEEPKMFLPAPFKRRVIVPPVEGEPLPSQTAGYCDESNWKKVDLIVGRTADGGFRVDEAAWDRAMLGSKAGLATWMSQCHEEGSAIEIVAAESGRRLATYDPRSGLNTL